MRLRDLLITVLVLLPLSLHAVFCGNQGSVSPSIRSSQPRVDGQPLLEPADASRPAIPATAGPVPARVDRQQLSGVELETVDRWTLRRSVRLRGRVVADEARQPRVSALVRECGPEVGPARRDQVVDQGVVLAAYHDLGEPFAQTDADGTTPDLAPIVEIPSPVGGCVRPRSGSKGQRFEPSSGPHGTAELNRVWILASAFEDDARYFEPGARVTITHPGSDRRLVARVSSLVPRSNPALRTVEVRLQADDPGVVLRPGMLVEVERLDEPGPALTVPR